MKKLLLLLFLALSTHAWGQKATPFVIGTTHEFASTQLGESRKLNVYLPEGYQRSDTTKYPVLYLLDGTANEDFLHICGLVQFLNMMGMMRPTIVVGIANVDRKRDFTFPTTIEKDKKDFPTTGGSEKFIAFLEKEVQPFVEKQYKTNSVKMLIGQSLGGLLATEIMLKKPQMFNQYIIVSPSLWWDRESLLRQYDSLPATHFTQKTAVYVAVGKEGKVMERDARGLAKALEKHGSAQLTVHFGYFPKEDHATILHNAVYKALNVLEK